MCYKKLLTAQAQSMAPQPECIVDLGFDHLHSLPDSPPSLSRLPKEYQHICLTYQRDSSTQYWDHKTDLLLHIKTLRTTAPQGLAEYLRELPHGGPQFIKDNLKDPYLTPPNLNPGSMKGVIRNMTSVAFALLEGATWLPGRQPQLTGLQVTTSSTI
jgi:hypothetical protein